MFKQVALVVPLLLLVFSIACNKQQKSADDTSGAIQVQLTPTGPGGADISPTLSPEEQRLQQAALKIEDMPANWAVAQDTTSGPRDLGLSFCNSDPVDVPNIASVETVFTQGQDILVNQIIASYPDNDASQVIARLKQTVTDCPSWTETAPDGSKIAFQIAPVDFPALGDEAVAFEIGVATESPVERGVLVLVRRGTLLNLIIRLDVGGDISQDPSLMERAAKRADEKLQQLGP